MKKVLFNITLLLLFNQCDEYEASKREYPRVSTQEVTLISRLSATFNGEILHAGSDQVIECGFVFSDIHSGILSEDYSEKIIVEKPVSIGKFSQTVDWDFKPGVDYYMRAYAKTHRHLVYGNIVIFSAH